MGVTEGTAKTRMARLCQRVRMMAKPRALGTRGQATVEMAVAIPVFIAVAAICFNVMVFLGDCASFDREFRNAVRIYATSPGYNESPSRAAAQIREYLQGLYDEDCIEVSVAAFDTAAGLTFFQATADFAPTLFGQELRDEIFGITLPHAQHSDEFAVDAFQIGVIPWQYEK